MLLTIGIVGLPNVGKSTLFKVPIRQKRIEDPRFVDYALRRTNRDTYKTT